MSLKTLKNILNEFDYGYTIPMVKELLDSLLNNNFNNELYCSAKFKYCLNSVFNNNEYEQLDNKTDYTDSDCFPENWVAPIGNINLK